MKIHGTSKGGAESKKDFGVAFTATSGAFSPSDISNMLVWWDFSAVATVTKSGSNRVSKVDDKSGNGHDLVQTDADDQPLWVSEDQNDLDVINFVGDRWMEVSFSAVSQPITTAGAFVVPDNGNLTVWEGDSGGGRLRTVANVAVEETMGINSGSLLTSNAVANLYESWSYQTAIYNSSSSKIRINGSEEASGDCGTNAQAGFKISTEGGGGGFANQKMGEIIAYSKVVSGTELEDLETYLSEKWDIS